MIDGKRKRLAPEDSYQLIEAFAKNPRPNQQERNELAQKLGLNARSIQIWFQNRRAKMKRESNDPDLFSKRPSKLGSENNLEIEPLPVATARNFKELCLPKYLDIPIKGHHISSEEYLKNQAIKKFWQNHQAFTHELEQQQQQHLELMKTTNSDSASIETGTEGDGKKKQKLSSNFNEQEKEFLNTFNMPDLVPFQDISNSNSPKIDFTEVSFLKKSIQEITEIKESNCFYYKPQLDILATNIDFVFESNSNLNINLVNFEGTSKRDNSLSEIFSIFPDIHYK